MAKKEYADNDEMSTEDSSVSHDEKDTSDLEAHIEAQRKKKLKELGDFARAALDKDESLESFANRANLAKSYLSRLLNGKLTSYPKVQTLEKIVLASNGRLVLNDLLPLIGMTPDPNGEPGLSYIPRDNSESIIETSSIPENIIWSAGTVAQNYLSGQGIYTSFIYEKNNEKSISRLEVVDISETSSFQIQNIIIPFPCFYNNITPTEAINSILWNLIDLQEKKGAIEIEKDMSNICFVTNSKVLYKQIKSDFKDRGLSPMVIFTEDNQTAKIFHDYEREVAFSRI